jgi:hypothetical protein
MLHTKESLKIKDLPVPSKNELANRFIKPHAVPMANKRPHVISITVNADELAACQGLAKEADMPMTSMLRGWLREKLARQAKRQA